MLDEANARENVEAVSAIDDFLERSKQEDVGETGGAAAAAAMKKKTPSTSGDVVNGATGAAATNADSGRGEGGERARSDDGGAGLKRRTGWMGSSRWSRNKQA